MIACVAPQYGTYEDTLNTLKYANRAKNIRTNPERNVLNVQEHISNYNKVIERLKGEIDALRA
jgi:kinesin family protein 18/19